MYVLAGPNGAGKSTLYETVLRASELLKATPFINADIIQRDELKDATMTASYKAAEIAEARRQQHLASGKDFISESTFSHPSKLALVDQARAAGFRVVIYHVNVRSPELSIHRVARRTKEGGHDVPEDKIRERYERNRELIRQAVLKADRAYIYDNSALNQRPTPAIFLRDGKVVRVTDRVPAWARELYAQELQHFSPSRLNPAAASFADAQQLAERLEPNARLRIPEKQSIHRGEIVGETALHWVQRIEPQLYTAHIKSALDHPLEVHRCYDISYPKRGAVVRPISPEEVQRTKEMAKAFLTSDETTATELYPELRGAYQALRALSKAMPAGNGAAAVTAKETLAKFVAAGRVPPATPEPKLAPTATASRKR